MENTRLLLCLILSITFWSCQQPIEPDLGTAADYLPNAHLLNEGIVNKYYSHYKANDSYDTETNISYRSYQLVKPNELNYNYYNPGFELEVKKSLAFLDDRQLLLREERYFRKDTFSIEIDKPLILNWQNPNGGSEKTATYPWGTRTWINTQESIRDTLIEGQKAKIFEGETIYITRYKGDTTKVLAQYQEIYRAGIGLYSQIIQDANGRSEMEVVEQIRMKAFQESANHGRHRIAYIDQNNTLDNPATMKVCGINNRIYDYYNGRASRIYKGGKKAIWEIVQPQLDSEKLGKESGYLTFRFIINCEGEAGYFITEESDLDFKRKQFDSKLVTHFYEMVISMKDFTPTIIQKENVDAYAYLTFKLNDGELIDILP